MVRLCRAGSISPARGSTHMERADQMASVVSMVLEWAS